jgi:hypothetical protein
MVWIYITLAVCRRRVLHSTRYLLSFLSIGGISDSYGIYISKKLIIKDLVRKVKVKAEDF